MLNDLKFIDYNGDNRDRLGIDLGIEKTLLEKETVENWKKIFSSDQLDNLVGQFTDLADNVGLSAED